MITISVDLDADGILDLDADAEQFSDEEGEEEFAEEGHERPSRLRRAPSRLVASVQ